MILRQRWGRAHSLARFGSCVHAMDGTVVVRLLAALARPAPPLRATRAPSFLTIRARVRPLDGTRAGAAGGGNGPGRIRTCDQGVLSPLLSGPKSPLFEPDWTVSASARRLEPGLLTRGVMGLGFTPSKLRTMSIRQSAV